MRALIPLPSWQSIKNKEKPRFRVIDAYSCCFFVRKGTSRKQMLRFVDEIRADIEAGRFDTTESSQ